MAWSKRIYAKAYRFLSRAQSSQKIGSERLQGLVTTASLSFWLPGCLSKLSCNQNQRLGYSALIKAVHKADFPQNEKNIVNGVVRNMILSRRLLSSLVYQTPTGKASIRVWIQIFMSNSAITETLASSETSVACGPR